MGKHGVSGLKARESARVPIAHGEPIQWHLATSKYDVCPADDCGGQDIWYVGKRERFCPKCERTAKLLIPTTTWAVVMGLPVKYQAKVRKQPPGEEEAEELDGEPAADAKVIQLFPAKKDDDHNED